MSGWLPAKDGEVFINGTTRRLVVFVPGKPIAKARARSFVRGGKIMHYTPKQTRDYEQEIAITIRNAMIKHRIATVLDPIGLSVDALFPRPKRAHGSANTSKPDIDNVLKSVMDGIKRGGFVRDDCQIVDVHAKKMWCDPGHQGVMITLIYS